MTKQEQIEEIAKIQCDSCKKYSGEPEPESCDIAVCLSLRKKYAEALYNAGYRKIPDGGTAQEFAEKLKEKAEPVYDKNVIFTKIIYENTIDELLKEFLK